MKLLVWNREQNACLIFKLRRGYSQNMHDRDEFTSGHKINWSTNLQMSYADFPYMTWIVFTSHK